MINARQLRDVVSDNPDSREEMFRYFYAINRYGAMDSHSARLQFNTEMADPVQSGILLNTYVPEFNRNHPRHRPGRQGQSYPRIGMPKVNLRSIVNMIPRPDLSSRYMRRSLNKGVPIIAAGLAAIVAGEYIAEDEKSQQIITNIGYLLTATGAAGVFISYVRDKLR